MIEITTITSDAEIMQLLDLQQVNLPKNISKATALEQGFVTVQHNFELLRAMNEAIPQVIAKKDNRVVAYALIMLPDFADLIPVLQPMFQLFSSIYYGEKKVSDYNYYVMGQVCVAEDCRGKGVFDALYYKHRVLYSTDYQVCITEIAERNTRSMRAHERVGFQTIHTFQDETERWNVVAWNWKDKHE
jgi:GNAT superfamily N-acetyltransferase